MPFDEDSWRFPVEELAVSNAVLCVHRDQETGSIFCSGGRIDFEPISLPNINWAYEKSSQEDLSLEFQLPSFEFTGLDDLAGKTFAPTEAEQQESYGSIYAFSSHNPVDTIRAEFGVPADGRIPTKLMVRFDFEYEDAIGGIFEHQFAVDLAVEKRWRD